MNLEYFKLKSGRYKMKVINGKIKEYLLDGNLLFEGEYLIFFPFPFLSPFIYSPINFNLSSLLYSSSFPFFFHLNIHL